MVSGGGGAHGSGGDARASGSWLAGNFKKRVARRRTTSVAHNAGDLCGGLAQEYPPLPDLMPAPHLTSWSSFFSGYLMKTAGHASPAPAPAPAPAPPVPPPPEFLAQPYSLSPGLGVRPPVRSGPAIPSTYPSGLDLLNWVPVAQRSAARTASGQASSIDLPAATSVGCVLTAPQPWRPAIKQWRPSSPPITTLNLLPLSTLDLQDPPAPPSSPTFSSIHLPLPTWIPATPTYSFIPQAEESSPSIPFFGARPVSHDPPVPDLLILEPSSQPLSRYPIRPTPRRLSPPDRPPAASAGDNAAKAEVAARKKAEAAARKAAANKRWRERKAMLAQQQVQEQVQSHVAGNVPATRSTLGPFVSQRPTGTGEDSTFVLFDQHSLHDAYDRGQHCKQLPMLTLPQDRLDIWVCSASWILPGLDLAKTWELYIGHDTVARNLIKRLQPPEMPVHTLPQLWTDSDSINTDSENLYAMTPAKLRGSTQDFGIVWLKRMKANEKTSDLLRCVVGCGKELLQLWRRYGSDGHGNQPSLHAYILGPTFLIQFTIPLVSMDSADCVARCIVGRLGGPRTIPGQQDVTIAGTW